MAHVFGIGRGVVGYCRPWPCGGAVAKPAEQCWQIWRSGQQRHAQCQWQLPYQTPHIDVATSRNRNYCQTEHAAVHLGAVTQHDRSSAQPAEHCPAWSRPVCPPQRGCPQPEQQQNAHALRPATPQVVVVGVGPRDRQDRGRHGRHEHVQSESQTKREHRQRRQDRQADGQFRRATRGVQPRRESEDRGHTGVEPEWVPRLNIDAATQCVDGFDVKGAVMGRDRRFDTRQGAPEHERW